MTEHHDRRHDLIDEVRVLARLSRDAEDAGDRLTAAATKRAMRDRLTELGELEGEASDART